MAGAGQKLHVPCTVGGRKCELQLDARLEIDCLTGKRRHGVMDRRNGPPKLPKHPAKLQGIIFW